MFLPYPGGYRQISSDSRLTHFLTLRCYRPIYICSTMVVPESHDKMYYPPDDIKRDAHVPDFNAYLALYRKSLENPEGRSNASSSFFVQYLQCLLASHLRLNLHAHSISLCLSALSAARDTDIKYHFVSAFWKSTADEFFWKEPGTGPLMQYNFDVTKGNIYVKCMEGAKTNMCYNVLDRLVKEKNLGEKVAYYW